MPFIPLNKNEREVDKKYEISLGKLLYKIDQCIDYQNLYSLEEDFNKVGLTIQSTSRNRMILCRLLNGAPITEKVIDDYIYIGGTDELSKELTNRTTEKIADFVKTNAGPPGKIENIARVWQNGLRMYQNKIAIVNEDIDRISGEIINE
jgi:hypothetical protein